VAWQVLAVRGYRLIAAHAKGLKPTLLVIHKERRTCYNMGTTTGGTVGSAHFFVAQKGETQMPNPDSTDESKTMNEENDAREEDEIKDADADTRDVEETERREGDDTERRFSSIEATLDKILGQLSSLREAQGIMVENGAVVHETEPEVDLSGTDNFIPPKDLDLLM
jgi:hypothetical protein